MKRFTYLIVILLLSANSFAQGHFVVDFNGLGQEHMTIYVVNATIGGVALETGDEIAAFDGAVCCGKAELKQPIDITKKSTFAIVAASKADDGLLNGYTVGNAITFKFWDSSQNKEIPGITTEYLNSVTGQPTSEPTFTANVTAFVKLSVAAPVNQTPVADAGADQSVNEGATATLDGSASSDPDGDVLTYKWTAPAGITLSSETEAKPTFTALEVIADTEFTFSLVVNDGKADSPADEVLITVMQVNKAPTANAGDDQTVSKGALVTLDGTASSDPDGDALTYKWTAPAGITLSSATDAKPTFTAPAVIADTEFTFSLVVNDGKIDSPEDQIVIKVKPTNVPPVANAGEDQSVNEGATVTLDGSASSDPDGDALTYKWTAPPGIALSSETDAQPTFTAPEVIADTEFTFSLVVNDGKEDSPADEVVVTVLQINKVPTANAGIDQSVLQGELVTLDGSTSSDTDGDALTYKWTAPAGITLSSATEAKPTFTAPAVSADTEYTFSLVVNDGKIDSPEDQVVIKVKPTNITPVANAGEDQSVNEGATATLEGSASSDPDGDALTYKWTAPAGITLSSETDAQPTFTAPEVIADTEFTFSLVVNDGKADSPADEVVITVLQINKVPTANAGIDQSVLKGELVTLDGSTSSDPDGDALTYKWTAPAGITLSSATEAKPTFTAPAVIAETEFTFSLVVNDGKIDSPEDQTVIKVKPTNVPPVANAGEDQSVNEGATATLEGSASSDPDGDALTYKWTAPAGITLSSETDAQPTFTAPEVNADIEFTFSLVVNDGKADSPADEVVVTVLQINKVPTANAGIDQSVLKGELVTLDGSTSSDPDGDALTYKWTAPAGITLSSETEAKPTFTAPEVNADTQYTFSLVVNDGQADSPADEVVVTVFGLNNPPIANAGSDQTVNEGILVTLDGTASSDPDGDVLTYRWIAPPGITLSSTTVSKPTFTALEVIYNTELTFYLIVNDGHSDSQADQVVINVNNVNKPPVANAGPDQFINEGSVVMLDGTASFDPDKENFTHQWATPADQIPFSSPTIIKISATGQPVKTLTDYAFSLSFSDGSANPGNNGLIYNWIIPKGITFSSTTVYLLTIIPPKDANSNFTFSVAVFDGSDTSDPWHNGMTYFSIPTTEFAMGPKIVVKLSVAASEVTTLTSQTFSMKVIQGNDLSDPKNNHQAYRWTVPDGGKLGKTTLAQLTITAPEYPLITNFTYLLVIKNDPDIPNKNLTYRWTAPPGITLSSETEAQPTFTAPEVSADTQYTFSLVVNDGMDDSPADEVVITVLQINKAPGANAGTDQSVNEGATATLDGSASSDPDGDALTYKWTAPPGITLSSETIVNPTFTAPEVSADTQYTFSLVVNDGKADSPSDEVVITVLHINKVPVANAGIDQSVNEGATATLDGSASSDPEGDALTYKWTAPPGITLSSETIVNPTFTAPEVSADTQYTFSLVVKDGKSDSPANEVAITVLQVNKVPGANAGIDQFVNEGATASLNGSASADPDGDALTYKWTAPPGITLSSETIVNPTFTAPEVSADTQYTFSLVVNDGMADSPADEMVIKILNADHAPYVKNPIQNISVDKGAPDQIIDLKTVFADDDPGDVLTYSVTSNTNDQVVTTSLTGSELTLDFSDVNVTSSELVITASSNGKEVNSKFEVEVRILITSIDPLIEENQEISIYPNPTSGEIYLKFSQTPQNKTWITIYNLSGIILSQSIVDKQENYLNLNGFSAGTYFIKVDLKTYKIIILK